MKRISLLFLSVFHIVSFTYAQIPSAQLLEEYRKQYLPEKVFVHSDKNIYAAGETIWMAVYLLDGQTHSPGGFSTFVRIDLLNEAKEVVSHLKVFMPEGHGSGSIDLASDIASGDYQILAYTNFQRNGGDEIIFRKSIQIIQGVTNSNAKISVEEAPKNRISLETDSDNVNLRFFPEGGDCIEGLPCVVAMVAEDAYGNPVIVEGIISDQNRQPITFFKTNKLGMGVFSYTPRKRSQGYATISNTEKSFSLPPPLETGYALSVREQDEQIQVVCRSNLVNGLKNARVVVHHRGILFMDQELPTLEAVTLINIPREDMVPGVYVISLWNDKNEPVAERLIFSAPQKNASDIEVKMSHISPSIREQVALNISIPHVQDVVDSLAEAYISLSILPETSYQNMNEDDIRTWILLNSDVDFPIPHASKWIFEGDRKSQIRTINQYLMTRGWRRFTWKKLTSIDEYTPTFELERGLMIKGEMREYENKDKPRPGKIFLTQWEDQLFEEVLTDKEGNFSLGPYFFFDTTNIILQGRFKLGRKNRKREDITIEDNPYANIELRADNLSPQVEPFSTSRLKYLSDGLLVERKEDEHELIEYGRISRNMLIISQNFDSVLFQLEAVNISTQRTQPISPIERQRKERSFMYNGNPSYRMVLDSIPGASIGTNVVDLFYRIPGLSVIGNQIVVQGPSSFVGGNSPLLMVDGIPVSQDYLASLSVRDIEFIDLLKGADATIYGVRGGAGVILIYTRLGTTLSEDSNSPGILRSKLVGFHKVKEFAVFDHHDPANKDRPDIRTTLHWNPLIETNPSGSGKDVFTTSDQKGKFYIIAQGIRKDGQVLWGSTSFEVK